MFSTCVKITTHKGPPPSQMLPRRQRAHQSTQRQSSRSRFTPCAQPKTRRDTVDMHTGRHASVCPVRRKRVLGGVYVATVCLPACLVVSHPVGGFSHGQQKLGAMSRLVFVNEIHFQKYPPCCNRSWEKIGIIE